MKDLTTILAHLESFRNEKNRLGMAKFGIQTAHAFGISIPILRDLAKKIGKNTPLAIDLWESGYHEARLLAIFIADKNQIDEQLLETWVHDFNSWDICDQACSNLIAYQPNVTILIHNWAQSDKEFVRRAAFSTIACLALKKHKHPDTFYDPFWDLMVEYAYDDRNFVKKAVNWALRGMGKRNATLRTKAYACCELLRTQPHLSAKWIAQDALREFEQKYA